MSESESNYTCSTIAMLQTVRRCMGAVEYSMNRPAHLPGIVALYGPSGVGKSNAAAFVANHYRAYYVEMRSAWTKRALLESILKDMGIPADKNNYQMIDQICEQLGLSGRPLIIDEFDYAVQKGMIDLVRDIYEASNAPVLLIGEEQLSDKIRRKSARFHNRMLHWAEAAPATIEDALLLRDFYCNDVNVSDDLVNHIREVTHGCVRLICINLETIMQDARRTGLDSVSLNDWGNKKLYTGDAPRRRRA